jgi:outer membrane translocation and assembly module TamA
VGDAGAAGRAGRCSATPATRRFFGGGANDQRGLPERQLAPFATAASGTQVPYGGLAQATASAELRLAIPGLPAGSGVVAFLDGGDVTEGWDALALDRLHWATGLGWRLPTVGGAVRFDRGWRLNRYGAGEPRPDDRLALHLTIGEAY